MTILTLAEETGIDGYKIRELVKQRVSDAKKEKLPKGVRKLYKPTSNGNATRTLGSARKPCPDCGVRPPNVTEGCRRCHRREKDRESAELRRQARIAATPMCDAHTLDSVYSSDCAFRATMVIEDVPVCGVHGSRYLARKMPRTKCQAIEISDRFTPCMWKAKKYWTRTSDGKEIPVCGRHLSALNGSYGEQALSDIWRNKKQSQRQQLKQVDNT